MLVLLPLGAVHVFLSHDDKQFCLIQLQFLQLFVQYTMVMSPRWDQVTFCPILLTALITGTFRTITIVQFQKSNLGRMLSMAIVWLLLDVDDQKFITGLLIHMVLAFPAVVFMVPGWGWNLFVINHVLPFSPMSSCQPS